MHFRKITVVGVGLLGGSLGMAIRKRRLARTVAGFVRRAGAVGECTKLGAVDVATLDLTAAVAGADLVLLCTPLAQMRSLVRTMLPALKRGAIVTDVGSVKAGVVRELESIVQKRGAHFVGSHPMAGAEKTGVSAARSDLFENAVCVVTPTGRSNAGALRTVERFWTAIGARVLRLSAAKHDLLVGRSSHLPHVAAATLVNVVLGPGAPAEQARLCANGFRDTTRIASGSPEMWRDIVLANRGNVLRELRRFAGDIEKFRRALKGRDAGGVERFLEAARKRRDRWCAEFGSASPE